MVGAAVREVRPAVRPPTRAWREYAACMEPCGDIHDQHEVQKIFSISAAQLHGHEEREHERCLGQEMREREALVLLRRARHSLLGWLGRG